MSNFRFRRHMTVGDPSAEQDNFLTDTFHDTGDLAELRSLDSPRCIIVGRTGTGKSALIRRLEEINPHRTIRLHPHTLSLQYLEGSTIIPSLTAIGIRLNFFWTLFWRHIIALELIRSHYSIDGVERQNNFWLRIIRRGAHRDQRREAALEYLREWAGEFWKDSDVRTRKLFNTLEQKVNAAAGADIRALKLATDASARAENKTEEEWVARAQDAVSMIQFQHLDAVLSILRDDVLDDPQKPYYIVVDDLDKDWVEASYAYDLIDALVEEAGALRRLGNLKVIVALRENIVQQVNERLAGKRGRQREKHEGLMLRMRWRPADLQSMMDRRIEALMRGHYGERVSMENILPNKPHKGRRTGEAVDYILDRTVRRPRDLIKFFNFCIDAAAGRGRIEWKDILTAEAEYSPSQLLSLIDEWSENYPDISFVLNWFRGSPASFTLEEIDDDRLTLLLTHGEVVSTPGSLSTACAQFFKLASDAPRVLGAVLFPALFRIGFVGLKLSPQEPVRYQFQEPALLAGELPAGARIYIHPAYHLALAVRAGLENGVGAE